MVVGRVSVFVLVSMCGTISQPWWVQLHNNSTLECKTVHYNVKQYWNGSRKAKDAN